MKTIQSAGSNAGTVAGIKSGIDERVPNNHTGFATILSLPDGTQWLGLGRNKKSAQHDAAAKCLKDIKNIIVPLPEGAGLQTVGGTPGGDRDQYVIDQYIFNILTLPGHLVGLYPWYQVDVKMIQV